MSTHTHKHMYMVVMRKKDGVPIDGDFKRFNACTRFDSEPMCDQQAVLAKLTNSKFSSKLDLAKGILLYTIAHKQS